MPNQVDTQGQCLKLLAFLKSREKVSAVEMYRFVDHSFIRCPTARISELRKAGHIIHFDRAEKVFYYKGLMVSGQLNLLEITLTI